MSPILSARGGMSAGAYGWGALSAAGTSFESIATATGTGSSGTITFSSIPSTFKHLQIRYIARSSFASTGANSIQIRFNSDTANNYARHYLRAFDPSGVSAGGTATTSRIEIIDVIPEANNTDIVGAGIIDILDYASTSKYKTTRALAGYDSNTINYATIVIGSGLWQSTSAITSIDLIIGSQNWTTATTFALYGIKESA